MGDFFGGGGGGYDTSGLEAATKQANALNKRIYEETREDVQPWYQMGTGAVSRLSDLLGISGGSVLSRDQLMDSLRDDYTTTTTTQNNPALGGLTAGQKQLVNQGKALGAYRVNSQPATTTRTTVDIDGLNSAVDAAMVEQGTPEDYGSLLKTFGMDQFEADPGYQFRQDEANKQLERQMASQGITLGGAGYGEINPAAYKAMQELNQGLASQEYGAARGRYIEDQLNTFNMLMGAAGMGQGATSTMAGAGQNYAQAFGQNVQGLAAAQQNAQLAQASKPSMFSQLLGAGAQLGGAYLGNPMSFL